MSEETIATQEFQVERKTIRLALKENVRGRFLRITETVGGKHDTIIIPDTGLVELAKALADIMQASSERLPKADGAS